MPTNRDAVEPSPLEERSDEELLAAVRGGDLAGYSVLYRRHRDTALVHARRFSALEDPQDVVQEAFLKVLKALRQGEGPQRGFAGYLVRTVRNEAIDRSRRAREIAVEDVEEAGGAGTARSDGVDERLDRDLVRRAFTSLPEAWQQILWLTEVEGLAPRTVAPRLQQSPGAVAQLSRRAREGLRTAWLQAHIDAAGSDERCRRTIESLAAYERGQLTPARAAKVEAHLEECERCAAVLAELAPVSTRLRGVLLPLVLGSPLLLVSMQAMFAAPGAPLGLSFTLGAAGAHGAAASSVAATGAAGPTGGAGAGAGGALARSGLRTMFAGASGGAAVAVGSAAAALAVVGGVLVTQLPSGGTEDRALGASSTAQPQDPAAGPAGTSPAATPSTAAVPTTAATSGAVPSPAAVPAGDPSAAQPQEAGQSPVSLPTATAEHAEPLAPVTVTGGRGNSVPVVVAQPDGSGSAEHDAAPEREDGPTEEQVLGPTVPPVLLPPHVELPEPTDPVEPVEPVEPDEPAEPEDPVEPVEPEDPEDPVEPVEPEEPAEPEEPTEPAGPEEPVEPVEPTDPVEPVEPSEPTEPEEPVEPEDPDEPTEPEEPVDPEPVAPAVTAPEAGTYALPVTLGGEGTPGAVVRLLDQDGQEAAVAVVGEDGTWSAVPAPGPVDAVTQYTAVEVVDGIASEPSAPTPEYVFVAPVLQDPADGATIPVNISLGKDPQARVFLEIALPEGEEYSLFVDGEETQLSPPPSGRPARHRIVLAPGEHTLALAYREAGTGRLGALRTVHVTVE